MAVLLFDIDGTLIRKAGPHHRQVLVDSVQAVTGLKSTTDNIPVQGMLDRTILSQMLRNAGASEAAIRRAMPYLVEKAQSLYARRCPDLRTKVCPGVRGLLYRLRRRGAKMGLVTGNLSRIGWKKMERAGLRHNFAFGAFAESGKTRADLVRLALRQARAEGWLGKSTPVALVGDHENDILAARANDIASISVATGISSREELASLKPDFLLNDLRQFPFEHFL